MIPAAKAQENPKPDGETFIITRAELDKINTIIDSEKQCRIDLRSCLEKPIAHETRTGWSPAWVVGLGSVVLLGAFFGGMAIGNRL